jgi:prephenate dehydrogenase
VVKRVAIIGLGLIGGSIGLALRRADIEGLELVGCARHAETLAHARRLGIIDTAELNPAAAAEGADLVIIATPVMAIETIFKQIADKLLPNCVVTDTASTKVYVMEGARRYLPPGISFVGGHPMAGSEKSGIAAASVTLLDGCTYCLSPASDAAPEAVQSVVELVERMGATPFFIDAEEHDEQVAGISHLPTLLSAALILTTVKSPHWDGMSQLAASGYRDLTRLASGEPRMNRDIGLTNGKNITDWLDRFAQELGEFRRLLTEDGEELEEALTRAREAHRRWLEERK